MRNRRAAFALSIAVYLSTGFSLPMTAFADGQAAVTVSYENLSELLTAGSLELKQANDSYETNRNHYQGMLNQLREEQDYMKLLADQNDDDPEAKAVYKDNAAMLGSSARQVSRQLERLNRRSSTRAVQDNIDSYTRVAQSRMNSCNQMILQEAAQEKTVEAARAAYEALQVQQAAGMVSVNEVLSAADALSRQQNQLVSYRQQAASQRRELLAMLGLEDNDTVTIGTVPEPDLAAIAAIDFESDKQRAIGNHDSVLNARHATAGSMAEIEQRRRNVAVAEGNAEADYVALYQELMEKQVEYQAAADAYESGEINYRSLLLRYQAGMLDREGYIRGEARYLQTVAARGRASMNLVQAYEDYCWGVKGVSSI